MLNSAQIVNKAFKYRLYPSSEQKIYFNKIFSANRLIYNHFLGLNTEAYSKWVQDKSGEKPSPFVASRELTSLKKEQSKLWLCDVPADTLFYTLRNLSTAWKNTFRRLKKGDKGFPKFKNKFKNQSFSVKGRDVHFLDNRVYLPKMREKGVKVVLHQEPLGRIVTATVSKTSSDKYFLSCQCEVEMSPFPKQERSVGVDLGISHLMTLSSGEKIENPKNLRLAEKGIKRCQRQLSKKKKGSKNRAKARLKLAKAHEKVANQRKYFLHNNSINLIKNYQNICVEDLNVSGMTKNHHLAKSINDAAWGELIRQLEYKSGWHGRNLIKVGRFFPSSKTCNVCGYKKEKMDLSTRNWTCPECNSNHDRDINAAINILNHGLSHGGGDSTRQQPVEPSQKSS
jgi:putative transposase